MHWIGSPGRLPIRCTARIRHRHPDQPCLATPDGDGLELAFDLPQRAMTPGQYVVLYEGERCLGGAEIVELLP
jgi:tRNA-specific 2-thiouridylase